MSDPVAEHEEAVEISKNTVVNGAEPAADGERDEAGPQPLELPVLPLRGMVVYPQTAVPLTVGQPRSMKLVDDAVNGDRVICLVASLDPDNETPGPDEICRIGTRSPDGTLRLLVQGLTRLRIDEFVAHDPWLKASVSEIPEDTEAEELEIEALTRNVVDQFTRMAEMVPSIPGELISSALNMEDPLQLVYAIATYVRIELGEAQNLLEIDSLESKLRHLMALLGKELEVLELGRKIQTEAESGMEKVQREYFLREQMKAIQRELGESDEQTAVKIQKDEEAQQAPERFIEEERVKAGIQRVFDQAAIGRDPAGGVDSDAPGQVGGRAVEFLVDEVGPAADRLPHRQRHCGDVQPGAGHQAIAAQVEQHAQQSAAHRAKDAQTAAPDGDGALLHVEEVLQHPDRGDAFIHQRRRREKDKPQTRAKDGRDDAPGQRAPNVFRVMAAATGQARRHVGRHQHRHDENNAVIA